jgi:small subunit ribosomal protein S1
MTEKDKPEILEKAPSPPKPEREALPSGRGLRNLDVDLDKELEAAMGGLSDKDLYGDLSKPRPKSGEQAQGRKKGKVIQVHGPDVFVSIPGGRSDGVLPILQFPDGPPAVGSEVEVDIEGYDPQSGLLLLTRKGAVQQADWSSISAGMIVEARVTATNKGGLSVDVNGIRGFMPISQIDLYRVENTEQYVNQRLRCVVTEVNPEERNLVVSARALMEQEREEKRDQLWRELAEGQVRTGVVRSVRDFGAFVDLGGADGLLHVSEMSWSRVSDPNSVVQVGQTVKVVLLKVDREHRKLSLGLKQLQASPWDDLEQRYPIGSIVKGKVTKLMEFGAFVELEPGVEGLIHISELAPQRVRRVGDIVKPDQEVQVAVLRLDPAGRKLSLSLKAALAKPEPEVEEEEEEAVEVKPRPRRTDLRGGIGESKFDELEGQEES